MPDSTVLPSCDTTGDQLQKICLSHSLVIGIFLWVQNESLSMPVLLAGLDARAAAIVMRAVRNIVNTGRTIVCTIHQPSIDIFESFDELLLLKRGGETIFNGQLGKDSKDLIEYFQVRLLSLYLMSHLPSHQTSTLKQYMYEVWLVSAECGWGTPDRGGAQPCHLDAGGHHPRHGRQAGHQLR